MSASNRATLITKTHKVLAKHFKPVSPTERPVMEQLLYACCLEDARHEIADECFARLQESFFDWNEVRVTNVGELSEILRGLPSPERAATQLKQSLHSVFESIYAFDMDSIKKQNQGAAVKQLESYRGATPFTVSYVVQASLGGHAIPVCQGSMDAMVIVGVASEGDAKKGKIPGLERAIPKTKGVEFASLLHQLGAELVAKPFNPQVRSILLEINPDCKDRLPKRERKAPPDKKKKPAKAVDSKKKTAKKPAAKANADSAKKKKAVAKKAKKKITQRANKGTKKSTSKQLARRKPR